MLFLVHLTSVDVFCLFFHYFNLRYGIGVAPIMQLCTEHIQGSSPHVESDGPYTKELLLKERIHSLWEQILSFKRSSHFEKGRNWRESLLVQVVSLWCA